MMRFGVLGPLEVRGEDGERITVPRRKERALLGILVLLANETVSSDTIVDALWDGGAPASVMANLHSYVADLRRLLDTPQLPGRDRIRTAGRGYLLAAGPDEVDAATFARLAAAGRSAAESGDPGSAEQLLARAVGLWRGRVLEGMTVPEYLAPEVTRLEELRLAAIEDWTDARLALGHHAALVAELRARTEAHPLRERLWGQLMLALYRSARRGEALEIYQAAHDVLAAELGVEPGPQLQRMRQLVLACDPDLTLRQPGPPRPIPRQLPPDVTAFTGREATLDLLDGLLSRPNSDPDGDTDSGAVVAIVDVAGMGGVGKTALAVHVAHREAASFPDGQLYVNLHGAEAAALDPGDVLAQFLRALGVDSRLIPADLAERSAMYRTRLADRRILVVLDNAASEQQVRPLLPGTGTCAVIVTSRARLTGIEGVQLIDLDVLAPPEALSLLAGVVGRERVDAEPAAAAEIVELCGSLPLAVRIAGGRLAARPAWWLAHLAARLRDERRRLDQLQTGDLAVRASLALSCQGLSGESRRLFQLLGLFDVPDFPGWLSAIVLGSSLVQAQEHTEALVDARLLTVAGVDAAGQVRYALHDLVRLVAREQAELEQSAERRVEALARGFGGWLAVAERMAAGVPGPCYAAISGPAPRTPIVDEQVLYIDPEGWFDAERATLLCLIRQAVRLNLHDVAFDLAGCLEKYFDLHGMYAEWVGTNEEVMAACRGAGNRLGEAVMLRGLIDVLTWLTEASGQGAMTRFHTDAFRLLDLFDELGHTRGTADAAVMCSWASTGVGAYGEAINLATRALRLAERSDHAGGLVRAHHALALAHFEQADVPLAAEHAANALEIARTLDNPRTEATALQFFGIALREVGELEASERMLAESLAISRRYRDNYTQALTMLALARLHVKRGDPRAREEVAASLAVSREYGMSHHLADALQILGEIELAEHRPEAAVAHLEESVSIWRTRGWRSFHATALASLGRAYLQIDRVAAERALGEAQNLYAELGNSSKVAELKCLLAGSGVALA